MRPPITFLLLSISLVITSTISSALAHDGPDPLMRWRFDPDSIRQVEGQTHLQAVLGPAGRISGGFQVMEDKPGGLFLEGGQTEILLANNYQMVKERLPREAFTFSAWVSIDKRLRWGGLFGALQDNGSEEFGLLIGYNNENFMFGLATEGGDSKLTYLSGVTEYELGKLYHVVAIYDGNTMQLFVNGKLDAESTAQGGPIAYPDRAPLVLGAYRDDDEFFGHRGRFLEMSLYGMAAKPEWVGAEFNHQAGLAELPAAPIWEPLKTVIDPYLQFGTQQSMTVMWKTNRPAKGKVFYGETAECENQLDAGSEAVVHEVKLSDLKPETQYFYRVESHVADGEPIKSEVATFQTAVETETPFAFAVISDTQGNPNVSGKLAEFAWGQRPNFLLHPGDLVSTGPNDSHWTEHFFPSMNPLIRHVPFYPVLGNHEQNARNYFDYVSLPTPEYYYTFQFGNTQFFMIDTNRNVDSESEQFKWLEQQLEKSNAEWKVVCHHHPPYSSDENDYGNLWKTNRGTRGDLRVRVLVELYERFDVDLVWNGHIHSYERTWPIRNGKAAEADAPIYMITGGGGGSLETAGPIRSFFQNTVRRGHHYSMVRVNGKVLEIQSYDIENRLFDQLVIRKTTD